MTEGGEMNPMYYQENIDKMLESRGKWDDEHKKCFPNQKWVKKIQCMVFHQQIKEKRVLNM